MIALAVADRPLVRMLFAQREIEVDYVETSGPSAETIREAVSHQRFLLHNSVWNWSLAHRDCLNQQNVIPMTLNMIERLRAPWFSLHLGFSAEEVTFDGWMKPLTLALSEPVLFERMTQNLQALTQLIPVRVMIENLDYNPGGAYDTICDPSFIARIVDTVDVGLLLDLAHARVSAHRLGMTIYAYLDQLPLDRVQQLHISGPRWIDDVLTDTHDSLLEEDYALLKYVLERTHPWALTLEYGKDAALLKQDLDRLRSILQKVNVG